MLLVHACWVVSCITDTAFCDSAAGGLYSYQGVAGSGWLWLQVATWTHQSITALQQTSIATTANVQGIYTAIKDLQIRVTSGGRCITGTCSGLCMPFQLQREHR